MKSIKHAIIKEHLDVMKQLVVPFPTSLMCRNVFGLHDTFVCSTKGLNHQSKQNTQHKCNVRA